MAKGIRLGVGGVKTSKKGWVGVNSVARKVKKIFGGVGGIVKLLFSTDIAKVGSLSRSVSGWDSAGAENLTHALFSDGGGSPTTTIDAFNTSLVRSNPTPLSEARASLTGGRIGNYALFAGGGYYSRTVDAYNQSLVRTSPAVLDKPRQAPAFARAGSAYGIFNAGYAGNDYGVQSVEAYNTSLVKTTLDHNYYNYGHQLGGATAGNHAVFAGGRYGNSRAWAAAISTSLVRSGLADLSFTGYCVGVSVGKYAVFMGGYKKMDAYNASLVKVTLPDPINPLYAACTVGDYAIVASAGVAYAIDVTLVRIALPLLSPDRRPSAYAAVGSYGLFAGTSGTQGTVIDVYEV